MQLYAILRRDGWKSGEELGKAAARSTKVGDEQMADEVRWIRSYVLDEGAGAVGMVCIYEATSPEAIRKHASLALCRWPCRVRRRLVFPPNRMASCRCRR